MIFLKSSIHYASSFFGLVAQLVEQRPLKAMVVGSNPTQSTMKKSKTARQSGFLFFHFDRWWYENPNGRECNERTRSTTDSTSRKRRVPSTRDWEPRIPPSPPNRFTKSLTSSNTFFWSVWLGKLRIKLFYTKWKLVHINTTWVALEFIMWP